MESPEMGMGSPDAPKQEKIFISSEWTPEERKALLELMNKKIEEINDEDAKTRKLVKWESPYLKELARKKSYIQDLAGKLADEVPSSFLEINRQNFRDFILHV